MCQMELKSSLKAVDKVLGESSALYNSLKEQCDSLETVLVEYGYNYEENNDSQQGQPRYSIMVFFFPKISLIFSFSFTLFFSHRQHRLLLAS